MTHAKPTSEEFEVKANVVDAQADRCSMVVEISR
jgi:hypothetical protein